MLFNIFCVFVRLDEGKGVVNTRRQLYSLYTNSGSGLGKSFTIHYCADRNKVSFKERWLAKLSSLCGAIVFLPMYM